MTHKDSKGWIISLHFHIVLLLIIGFHHSMASSHLDRSPVASFSEPLSPLHENNRLTSVVPLFYGWFFNQSIAESISIIGKKYFLASYDNIPHFQAFITDLMHQNNVSNPLEYYMKPLDPDSQQPDLHYHTTAKFCGRNDSSGECTEYLRQVGSYLGRPYKIHFVGLFFTRNTYGLRVKLTPQEQKLFRGDDRENSAQAMMTDNNETNIEVRSARGFAYEPYYFNNKGQAGGDHPFYPGIHFRPQEINFHPTESRAHVTLGCAPHIEAVQTGLDLLEIIDMEVSSYAHHKDFTIGGKEIPKAVLRQYKVYDDKEQEQTESTSFVVYPSEEMIAQAVFDAYL